LIEVISDVDN